MSFSTPQMFRLILPKWAIHAITILLVCAHPSVAQAKEVPKPIKTPDSIAPLGPKCKTAQLLDGKLFKLKNGKSEAYNIDHNEVGIYAIYFSASWCPPCRKFTPKLLKFYKKHRAKHKNFEIILVHHTERSPSAMMRYLKSALKKAGMNETFPVMGFNSTPPDKKGIKVHATKAIPGFVLLNGDEKVLAGSYEGYKYIGPEKALKKLHELIGVEEEKEAPAKKRAANNTQPSAKQPQPPTQASAPKAAS